MRRIWLLRTHRSPEKASRVTTKQGERAETAWSNNATLLSQLLAHKERRGDAQGAALVKQAFPVAWQHINLYGRYEFRKPPEPVNVDEIVRELAEIRIGTEAALAP